MPISRPDNIPIVISEVIKLNPKSILDVGIGFGIYGVLFRACTDIRLSELTPSRYKKWEVKIDGIEIFESYRNSNYDNYNHIYYGSALTVLGNLIVDELSYDLIYLGDIIEHFDKKSGFYLLRLCKKLGKNIIISTPKYFRPQTDVLGNEHEKHLSLWTKEDFEETTKIYETEYQRVIIL